MCVHLFCWSVQLLFECQPLAKIMAFGEATEKGVAHGEPPPFLYYDHGFCVQRCCDANSKQIPNNWCSMECRKIVHRPIRDKILDFIYCASSCINLRVCIGMRLLCIHINLWPGKLLVIKKTSIDLEAGLKLNHLNNWKTIWI